MNPITDIGVNIISDRLKLAGTLVYPERTGLFPAVLFIHGGGRYSENLYREWQHYLAENNIASLSFFHRGVGTSEGIFSDSSLNNRLKDAEAAYDYLAGCSRININNISIYGSSMGGHVAVRFVQKHPEINSLILQSAAAYSLQSEMLPLNDLFKAEISKTDSWLNSPVFEIIGKFPGNCLAVYGENDAVIPEGIKFKYKNSIQKGSFITIKNGQHTLLRPVSDPEKQARRELFRTVRDFILENIR
jgi:dienelactone hydrolase